MEGAGRRWTVGDAPRQRRVSAPIEPLTARRAMIALVVSMFWGGNRSNE
jgi:hypothetical protein